MINTTPEQFFKIPVAVLILPEGSSTRADVQAIHNGYLVVTFPVESPIGKAVLKITSGNVVRQWSVDLPHGISRISRIVEIGEPSEIIDAE